MQPIDCPPYAPLLMESTRAIGYSIETAIADIIDNSLTAEASEIQICFMPYDVPFIAIIDNGKGMESGKLTEAMRYGSCNPNDTRATNDLGRYGLGLKTASLSQCRCLTVVSKQKNIINARQWDLDHIALTKKWSLLQLTDKEIIELPFIDKLFANDSGTFVLWSKLDKFTIGSVSFEEAFNNQMDRVREHLELVFHRYLSGDGVKKVCISINGIDIIAFDPFFSAKSNIMMDDEKIELPGRKGKVIIRPYILPHPDNMTKAELDKYGGKEGLRRWQGFYIYRNNRLLTWGTWFKLIKMDEYSKLARVRVDIPNCLDDMWTLDIKKSTAYPPEVVKIRLKQLVSNITTSSKRTWSFRARKEQDDNVSHIWERMETREGIRYFINKDYPMVELVNEQLNDYGKKVLSIYLDTVQNNLPINILHNDIHNEVKIGKDQEKIEKARICDIARELMQKGKNEGELDTIFKKFENIEPFNEYLDILQIIYEEVDSNNG